MRKTFCFEKKLDLGARRADPCLLPFFNATYTVPKSHMFVSGYRVGLVSIDIRNRIQLKQQED